MYPSDYGYATSGGTTENRTYCLARRCLFNWGASDGGDCIDNDWLFNSAVQWTLAPESDNQNRAIRIHSGGDVDYSRIVYDTNGVRPVVFLKSNIKIVGGNGTSSNPYILSN